ncbi:MULTISPECIES: phosphate ABC transporter substrate-binding protein PstS [unclassified Solwaraspora]|uniref:phosphate ABC transporter substrate-binding protein PstS n=1 Tax=unclassified Solwaraspora TaxID=2627926 RepID=UPI00248B6329|nr:MULTISPECIES: phosphate ABC transporter substrate-binding protein PstS [unclassified Solwaraspora]WBB97553.1 phosphate ABC transporter substrate-binding protein PstS [Solwaraspora sp. WMMA2059]WBC18554.1 phosphate ABC transporter substrate-binding protein PstS [Solwaraspora sp. WMMA2080]WJK34033.1 phosphate ABC transporter substrate-binding protein PstS [Solwaraspora sp. WMMA2065]
MNRKSLRLAALPAAVMLTLGVAACGDDGDNGSESGNGSDTSVSGNLAGAGASSQGAAMEAWIAGFTSVAPDATVTYDPIGSGGGREQFTSGGTQFGGTDAYLDEEEIAAALETCGEQGFIEFPGYISPIAVAYNLPGVETLNLSPSVMARIFDVKITNWNDPAIAELNPDAALPDLAITTVHRSDESGTTENFVDYLAKAAPADWPYEVDGNWPAAGGEAAPQNQGVAAALRGGEGTIGYIDASLAGDLGVAAVQVGEDFVEYSAEAAAAVVDAAETVPGRPEFSFAIDLPRDTAEAGVYPIVLVSYQLACVTYDSQETVDLVKAFYSYVISEEGQQAAAENAGSAPISDELRSQAQSALDAITVAG